MVRIGMKIDLIQSSGTGLTDDSIFDGAHSQYLLRKVELQVISGGQLLLAVRNAVWPSLTLVSDLVKSGVLEFPDGDITLYLAPTGQLARYQGGWVGSQELAQKQSEQQHDGSSLDAKRRMRHIEKTREWISGRMGSSSGIDMETIWIEMQIAVLAKPSGDVDEGRVLLWKNIFWPAQVSYMFRISPTHGLRDDTITSDRDPLRAAEDWLTTGAAVLLQSKQEQEEAEREYRHDNGPLFDDDIHFGSPQHFMSFPPQGMPHSQSVYPTPPDVMNAQPTPGVSIADGAAQTPATLQPPHPSTYHSSPLARMTDAPPNPAFEATISTFMNHDEDEDEDLFDDMEDQKLGPTSFADEPNWDFFDRGSPNGELETDKHNGSEPEETVAVAEEVDESQGEIVNTEPDASEADPPEDKPPALSTHIEADAPPDVEAPVEVVETPQEADFAFARSNKGLGSSHPRVSLFAGGNMDKIEKPMQGLTQSVKRRRSSAYDIEPQAEDVRDSKYAANGKYWFDLKKQSTSLASHANRAPLPRPLSSNSSSSNLSSKGRSEIDEKDGLETVLKPWAHYDPASTINVQEVAEDEKFDMTECDAELGDLLQLISAASGDEPFNTPMPRDGQPKVSLQNDPHRTSMVVQILNEQLVQSSLLKTSDDLRLPETLRSLSLDVSFESAGSNSALNSASLGDLATIQPANTQIKPVVKITSLGHGRIHLKQSDREITAELSILKFWETMNLQPLRGKKDALAICIHPAGEVYAEGSRDFLRRLSETYSNCNLGNHQVVDLKGLVQAGLAAWQSASDSTELTSLCHKIGQALGRHQGTQTCTVVYMIIPKDDLSRCYEMCDAFVELFEGFVQTKVSTQGDLALQLVPSSFVASSETLIIPLHEQYVALALEVYSRMPPTDRLSLPAASALALELDRPAHPFLQFELDIKVASPLQRYGNCCHLAYSVSSNQKWLVATWSDSVGAVALSMAYCLLNDDGSLTRPRLEIFKHLSETSTQLMNYQKSKWWLAVVKCGLYEVDELQEWLYTSGQLNDEHELLTRVVLLNAELQSRLSLHTAGITSKQFQSSSQAANALSTPVTTPQATTTSPDQTVPMTPVTGPTAAASAQTPPDLNTETGGDYETYLVDPLEDSWMTTFAFGLNQSHNSVDIRPALASGLLLKRTNSDAKGGGDMAVLGVNLIAAPRKPVAPVTLQEREQILQDILVQYRGLHTLAVARRCIDPRGNCVPWHIASAFKGANILGRLV